jgi:DNA-binding CsgD family transcriptional regulator
VANAINVARSASPQIVWIEGESGIGKTAFMRHFLSGVKHVTVLEASGEESETTLDYGVIIQLLAQAVPGTTFYGLQQRVTDPSRVSSFSMGAELLAALGSLQDQAPVVIAIDDAHWLDESSAGALLFALRRLHGDRVLVLIVSRRDELDRFGTGWARLLADPYRVHHIGLSGLTTQEVSELSDSLGRGLLNATASERLRIHTGGHPLHIRALLGELDPTWLASGTGALPAPRSFAATILARLMVLSPDAQNLVAAAAVAGSHCSMELASAAAGIADPLPALEEALAADLLTVVRTRGIDELGFPHPLIRAAVYDDLSPKRRRELHLACGALASEAQALAHRVAASPGGDDELAAELRKSAETEIDAGRLTAGVEQLLAASRIASDSIVRETALLDAVHFLAQAGDTRAIRMLDSVLACSDSARRRYTEATLMIVSGRLMEARDALLEVIARNDGSGDRDLEGEVAALLSVTCALQRLGDEAVQWAERALGIEMLSPTARATATQGLAIGLAASGRATEGVAELAHLTSSRAEPEAFDAELLATRASLKTWCGDLAGAAADLSAVVTWSRAGVPFRSVPNAYATLADVEYHLGHWDDGLTHADVAISLGEENERPWELAYGHAVAAYLHAVRGNFTTAIEHVVSAKAAAESAPLPMSFFHAASATAQLAWVRGDWEGVLQALEFLVNPLEQASPGLPPRVVRSMVAEAMVFSGRLDDADAMLVGLAQQSAVAPYPDRTAIDLWRLRGALAHARGQTTEAEEAFERGKVAAGSVRAPLAAALLELGFGQFLRRTKQRRAATAALQSAYAQLSTLGAQPFCDRAEAELSACGVRWATRGSDNRYGLSPREEVVARLVASGKTNREVAGELYLSTKAIEYHLGNVFGKVGVRSRRELAARLNGTQVDAPDQTAAHSFD